VSGPRVPRRPRRRLGPDDWAAAALEALGEGGLTAVAVEPLAARLGATKGSFYWHFANREALVAAALQLWESRRTEAVIALLDTESDPLRRLRRLFAEAVDASTRDRVEVTLLAAAEDPQVGPALRRVTERRIDYVARIFRELGLSAEEARTRAMIGFSTYLGNAQLAHIAPQTLPEEVDRRRAYLDRTIALLTVDIAAPRTTPQATTGCAATTGPELTEGELPAP
jgi:AcrR family transcriptional regulator